MTSMRAGSRAVIPRASAHRVDSSDFVNRTRTSSSIPRKLLDSRMPHLLPLYWLLRTSDLAREGIENSGSYRFADHLYLAHPSGTGIIGSIVDRALLAAPSARSFRDRNLFTRDCIVHFARRHADRGEVRVLSAPCGIARELVDAATILEREHPEALHHLHLLGLDIDPQPLALSRQLARQAGVRSLALAQVDLLQPGALPEPLDLITSTGIGEFLDDERLVDFYARCRAALRHTGWLVTSATRRHPVSDFLLRNLGELHTHYREGPPQVRLLRTAGFRHVFLRPDRIGYQTLAVAVA